MTEIPKNPILAWYEVMEVLRVEGAPRVTQVALAQAAGFSPNYVSGYQREVGARVRPRIPEAAQRRRLDAGAKKVERLYARKGWITKGAPGGIPPKSWDAFAAAVPDHRKLSGEARRKPQPAAA